MFDRHKLLFQLSKLLLELVYFVLIDTLLINPVNCLSDSCPYVFLIPAMILDVPSVALASDHSLLSPLQLISQLVHNLHELGACLCKLHLLRVVLLVFREKTPEPVLRLRVLSNRLLVRADQFVAHCCARVRGEKGG